MAFDDSHSPKYQKFKIDELPLVTDFRQGRTYKELIPYDEKRYGKKICPVRRRSECDIQVMNAATRSIIGYQVSDNRGVGSCILAMRMVFRRLERLPEMTERPNRTYKVSYRHTNGFDNIDGANYDLALWIAYYNFLRPHKHNKYNVLNKVEMLQGADNMPGKWQLLIYLSQQTILTMQKNGAVTPERSCCQ